MNRAWIAVLRKDLTIELRSREGVASLLVLGLLVLLVLQFALPERKNAEAAAAGLWLAFVLAGTVGAQRTFLLERENLALHGLVTAPIAASTIYLAKVVATMIQLGLLQLFVLPLVAVFFDVTLAASLLPLLVVCALANVGFSAVATLFAAIAVRTRAREVMLPLLVLPLVVPLLIGAVGASSALLAGAPFAAVSTWVQMLAAFDVVFTVAGWLLFEYVIRE